MRKKNKHKSRNFGAKEFSAWTEILNRVCQSDLTKQRKESVSFKIDQLKLSNQGSKKKKNNEKEWRKSMGLMVYHYEKQC